MGIYEFNVLTIDEQQAILWNEATFLTNLKQEKFGLSLYRLFDFYAEVHLNNRTNKIEKVRTFKSLKALEPYLDNIDLEQLYDS